jgi:hypothetical protein
VTSARVARKIAGAALAFAALWVFASCSSPAAGPAPRDAGSDGTSLVQVSKSPPTVDPACLQGRVDGTVAPKATIYLYPRHPITPFYQWEANDGYCGEVSLIQAGLGSGQWMSQLTAREICGAAGNGMDAPRGLPLSQSGPDGFCAAHKSTPDYNAQLLLEDDASANAATCLANARLDHRTYLYDGTPGLPGYRRFLSWVKAETMAGHAVAIGVLVRLAPDEQYDHIASVLSIGTNHAPTDASYYDDDVLYLDDHGAITAPLLDTPTIPPDSRKGASGCAPFVFGYTFGELAKTRLAADIAPHVFSILIPGVPKSQTNTGGNGIGYGPTVTGRNYAFSVSGPEDSDGTTLPVTVRIASTTTAGKPNPMDPVAGYNYENPCIGSNTYGASCTNLPPTTMSMTLEVTVSGLAASRHYNLYEYDVDSVSGTAASAALSVPTSRFNAQAGMAARVTPILAEGPTFVTRVDRSSRQTVVFRAVPQEAP